MRINVTLRQLEAFLALARTLSFGEAAKSVHLSQPAFSATIRKMEQALGARLFDRNTRNVALTPAGAELFGVADELYKSFDNAFAGVGDFLRSKRGRLAIAASPSLAAGFLPEAIAVFQQAHPDIELQVHDVLSDVCIGMVRDGKADLALAAERFSDPSLTHRELYRDQPVLVCRADHPLAKRRTVTWRQLQPFKLVSSKSTSQLRHLVDAAFQQQGAALRPAFEVEHMSTIIGFVAQGLGIGVLPSSTTQVFKLGAVVFRRIVEPEVHRTICAVTLGSRSLSPAAEAFLRVCVEHAEKRNAMSKR